MDLNFSVVVSARHYLSTLKFRAQGRAPRTFLGVGEPSLGSSHAIELVDAYRTAIKTRNGTADLRELPETADELKTAARLFGQQSAEILLRDDATEERFRAKPLADYDVIHFATHGLLKEELPGLLEPALLLTPREGDDDLNDGLLQASEISRLSLNSRLVILSACNTAKYDVAQASTAVQDLQTAFTIAGAPTLLASLWPVESRTAQQLVTNFAIEWQHQRGAADALARGTRKFLQYADDAHQHPRFWAPFVVVGNGAAGGPAVEDHATSSVTFQVLDGFNLAVKFSTPRA